MSLIHCIYSSAAVPGFEERDLPGILDVSRWNNQRLGVTGMLLYVQGSFFQVLEGPAASVDPLYESITRDARHTRVTCIIREAIARRTFPDWTMGYATMSGAAVRSIVGGNDFFAAASCLAALDDSRAKKLLTAFARGRWRTHVLAA
jgi:hypothetical protein